MIINFIFIINYWLPETSFVLSLSFLRNYRTQLFSIRWFASDPIAGCVILNKIIRARKRMSNYCTIICFAMKQ